MYQPGKRHAVVIEERPGILDGETMQDRHGLGKGDSNALNARAVVFNPKND